MARQALKNDVFNEGLNRLMHHYANGDRVLCSSSGGKDSTVCMELCRLAARQTGRLPVEVLHRDEEIMFPGTFEYLERLHEDPELDLQWKVANQPVINVFNREQPYFWVFDPELSPDDWVRRPPPYATPANCLNIGGLASVDTHPPAPGKRLIVVIGLRVSESPARRMGLTSSRGYLTNPNKWGQHLARPIYDWTDGDVWKAIADSGWDYNRAYDVMVRAGVPVKYQRIAPPTLNAAGLVTLQMAARSWPRWFTRVCNRLPGVKTAAMFGRRAVEPIRRVGELWSECYQRTCIDNAPEWIVRRALEVRENILLRHSRHAKDVFPEVHPCGKCAPINSWRNLCKIMYMGDPFALKTCGYGKLKALDPEYFRPGAGVWDGPPTW